MSNFRIKDQRENYTFRKMEIKSSTNGKIMAYTGRCWYCGSEDVKEYSDGSHECKECGMTWGGKQYVQRQVQKPRYRRTFSHSGESKEWEHSMKPYREKWRKREGKSPLTNLTVKKQGVNGMMQRFWLQMAVQYLLFYILLLPLSYMASQV